MLATQGWGRNNNTSFGYPTLIDLSQRFQYPLQHAGIDIAALDSEWDEIVDYAKRYLNISTEENIVIWWKLFNAPVSKDWLNILGLEKLLFSLLMSNGPWRESSPHLSSSRPIYVHVQYAAKKPSRARSVSHLTV